LAVILLVLIATACGGSEGAPVSATEMPTSTEDTLVILAQDGKSVRLSIEVADDPQETARGLMGRTELAEDAGMLFILSGSRRGFWMRGTLIPLSVAFIDECGEVVAIADMEPLSETVHNTDEPYYFGLEVNQGWFRENNVAIGSQVDIPAAYRRSGCA
jgi:uncharacterized membrane protein (UPF0127 family)